MKLRKFRTATARRETPQRYHTVTGFRRIDWQRTTVQVVAFIFVLYTLVCIAVIGSFICELITE